MPRKWAIVCLLTTLVVFISWRNKHNIPYDIPATWPDPVYDFKHGPLNKQQVALGRKLFYDPILSADSTISCNSCHAQYSAFTHVDHNLSHGIYGRIGRRNSPALFNLAWNKAFMWDGSVAHLVEQAQRPICNADEMGETMEHVLAKLQNDRQYRRLFSAAFGDSTITSPQLMTSLAQFLLTLVSMQSKYDLVMAGKDTFSTKEIKGYKLFKEHCNDCHAEPLFTNYSFQSNGLPVDTELNDLGKYTFTRNTADSFRFKVPSLRNIEFSPPYMHDGRFKTLYQVVNHYASGIKPNAAVPQKMAKGIHLTTDEKVELVAFLLTLSDTAFIRNQAYSYPREGN